MSSYTGQEIDNLITDLSPSFDTILDQASNMADFVVETVSNSTYSYKKYNSGYCDCTITYDPGTLTSGGQSWLGNDLYYVEVPFPSGLFTEVHSVVFTGSVTSALVLCGTIIYPPTTTSVICGVIGPGSSYPVKVFMVVKGKWK